MDEIERLRAQIRALDDALSSVSINTAAAVCAVRALIRSHPDRKALRREWDQEIAALWAYQVMAATTEKQTAKYRKRQADYEDLIGPS